MALPSLLSPSTRQPARRWAWRLLALANVLAGIVLLFLVMHRPPPPRHHVLPPDTGMAHVRATDTLRVALDASYPPFAVTAADGSVHGYDVDLAKAIAAEWGVHITFLNMGEDGLPDALIAGQADVIISGFHPDPRLGLLYSHAYYNAGQVLVVPASAAGVSGLGDLRGRTIAVELGSDADEWVRRQHLVAIDVQRLDSVQAAVTATAKGSVAGFITDRPTAEELVQQGAAVRIAGAPLTDEPYVVAAAPQNRSLITAVNAALSALAASGQMQALEQRDL